MRTVASPTEDVDKPSPPVKWRNEELGSEDLGVGRKVKIKALKVEMLKIRKKWVRRERRTFRVQILRNGRRAGLELDGNWVDELACGLSRLTEVGDSRSSLVRRGA